MTGLLDTNIALYLLGGRLADPLPQGVYAVSVITEMELLSFPRLTRSEESTIREFLSGLRLVELTAGVRQAAVRLRRDHGLKLPDAIVAASALTSDLELLTNDRRLAQTPGVRCRELRLR